MNRNWQSASLSCPLDLRSQIFRSYIEGNNGHDMKTKRRDWGPSCTGRLRQVHRMLVKLSAIRFQRGLESWSTHFGVRFVMEETVRGFLLQFPLSLHLFVSCLSYPYYRIAIVLHRRIVSPLAVQMRHQHNQTYHLHMMVHKRVTSPITSTKHGRGRNRGGWPRNVCKRKGEATALHNGRDLWGEGKPR